jgi:hypothetical protein
MRPSTSLCECTRQHPNLCRLLPSFKSKPNLHSFGVDGKSFPDTEVGYGSICDIGVDVRNFCYRGQSGKRRVDTACLRLSASRPLRGPYASLMTLPSRCDRSMASISVWRVMASLKSAVAVVPDCISLAKRA